MNEKICNCEYGPLGTGRIDSNTCPIHDAHNDKVATMLELVQRNQELKERVRQLEEVLKVISNKGISGRGLGNVLGEMRAIAREALKGE